MEKDKQKNANTTNEVGLTRVEGFLRISDPKTGKTIVETRA